MGEKEVHDELGSWFKASSENTGEEGEIFDELRELLRNRLMKYYLVEPESCKKWIEEDLPPILSNTTANSLVIDIHKALQVWLIWKIGISFAFWLC